MNSSGLWRDIKANPLILVAVVVFHVVLVVLLSMNLISSEVPRASVQAKETVKAVVVDAKKIDDAAKKRKQSEQKKIQQALAAKNELEAKKKKQADEKKRLAELEKKEVAEKKKNAEVEKKRIAVEKQKKEAETRRLVEEKRQKEQAEKIRLAAVEEQRLQDEQDAQDELRKRLEDEERREIEARQQAEHNKMLDSLRAQYVRLIEQKVERNWLRPVTSTKGMACEVVVTQTSLGDVMSVKLQQCASDVTFQQSVERAVRKASPLPPPPNPEVFDREIHFTFRPGS